MNFNNNNDELVAGIKSGSEAAFKLLFDSFHMKIYTVTRRMGMTNDEAEDVIQDSFLQLWKQKETINEELSLHGLLYTIAKRIALKKLQEKKNFHTVDCTENNNLPGYSNKTQEDIGFSETKYRVNEAINELPDQQRTVFLMNFNNGLSAYEIAEQLHVSRRTVENQIFRARKVLKAALIKNGILFLILALILNSK
jgi:RNA polymerase sigma-70 factor (family 1)